MPYYVSMAELVMAELHVVLIFLYSDRGTSNSLCSLIIFFFPGLLMQIEELAVMVQKVVLPFGYSLKIKS